MATPIPENRAPFALTALLAATGGRLSGVVCDEAMQLEGVSTDTRRVKTGQAFVALRGERFDGHDHLAAARDAGARLAIVERAAEGFDDMCQLVVPDSLAALGAIGRAHLRRWREADASRRVIALTGSAGKTTTKRAVYALLSRLMPAPVHTAKGNLNNLIGVPMTALELSDEHGAALFECGTNQPGEIAALARITEPDVGIVTLIAAAHTEGLGGIDGVAVEKGAMFDALGPSHVAIGNADDARVAARVGASAAGRRLLYGHAAEADVRIVERAMVGPDVARVRLMAGDVEHAFSTRLIGRAGALACAAAVATALALELPLDDAALAYAFGDLDAGGRLATRQVPFGAIVIDDSYNANPASSAASVETAQELSAALERPLVLVLGDMRELGEASVEAHQELGRLAATSGARLVIAVGAESAALADAARAAGATVQHCADSVAAADGVRAWAQPDDVVLVKGSRGIRTERVVDALAALGGASPAPGPRMHVGAAP